MYLIGTAISCGVNQLSGLTAAPETDLLSLGNLMFVNKQKHAFVVWSDTISRGRGEKLFEFIKEKFPNSKVQRTDSARNPNSQNQIRLYNWKVPPVTFRKWWDEKKK